MDYFKETSSSLKIKLMDIISDKYYILKYQVEFFIKNLQNEKSFSLEDIFRNDLTFIL